MNPILRSNLLKFPFERAVSCSSVKKTNGTASYEPREFKQNEIPISAVRTSFAFLDVEAEFYTVECLAVRTLTVMAYTYIHNFIKRYKVARTTNKYTH